VLDPTAFNKLHFRILLYERGFFSSCEWGYFAKLMFLTFETHERQTLFFSNGNSVLKGKQSARSSCI
jgi:hypothetical protein